MKFLIFNLAVAAALVFLFAADRGEVQRVAGQVRDAVGGVKDYARKALDDGKAALGGTVVPEPPEAAAPLPVEAPADARAEARPVAPQPPEAAPRGRSAPPRPPAPPRTAVAVAPPGDAIPPAPPGLDPAVAQRRKEVLEGIVSADPAPASSPAPALREGTRLMSAADRRKELLSLAEEMELLYARSVGR
jgi:hypothetical protein